MPSLCSSPNEFQESGGVVTFVVKLKVNDMSTIPYSSYPGKAKAFIDSNPSATAEIPFVVVLNDPCVPGSLILTASTPPSDTSGYSSAPKEFSLRDYANINIPDCPVSPTKVYVNYNNGGEAELVNDSYNNFKQDEKKLTLQRNSVSERPAGVYVYRFEVVAGTNNDLTQELSWTFTVTNPLTGLAFSDKAPVETRSANQGASQISIQLPT